MAKDNTKTLKDELRPLKDLLEIVKDKVDRMEVFQNVTMQQTRDIKDQQSVINGKLDEMQETLDAHTGSLMTIEKDLKGYVRVDAPPEFKLEPLPS